MNTDIEDFITTKNRLGTNDYNNFDPADFDIPACKQILTNLLKWIEKNNAIINLANNNKLVKKFEPEFNRQLRSFKKIGSMRKSQFLNIINKVLKPEDFDDDLQKHIELLKLLLRKKPGRNISGITSITVITAPFPNGQTFSCKHNCYYCPNEPAHKDNNWQAQPRSYLFQEPAVLRANQHKFLAIGQMLNRLDTYYSNGHVPDKIEIIVEGGTFTEYPQDYLEDYHRDLFYACNEYFNIRNAFDNYDNIGTDKLDLNCLKSIRQPGSVEEEVKINKTAHVHIIGICIETRPDAIDDEWLNLFRKWGITRIQLGAQHVDNSILKKINRGHTVEQLLWAMQYLKDNCFKIDIHIMPDLPGASPDIDREMFDYVYSHVCPDQMKVYPCEVVPWSVIKKWYDAGKYIPYFEKNNQDLVDVVRYSMETCPNWIRLPRVIRDIPAEYIECGNTIANLRQVIDQQLDKEGVVSQEIRSREIGRHSCYYEKPAGFNQYYYYANGGHDYFIAYESYDLHALFGFLRLRFVDTKNNMIKFPVLKNRGLIRELHVYGDNTAVNSYDRRGCQHTGIGKGLLKYAERLTMEQGLYGIVVISGEGVKGYYEKNGYYEVDTFMVKDFPFFEVWFYQFKTTWCFYLLMPSLIICVFVVRVLMLSI
jgi:ELP3 family radical SAM enzyme/protein acetyltransferase